LMDARLFKPQAMGLAADTGRHVGAHA
jgi:hypothetical protein